MKSKIANYPKIYNMPAGTHQIDFKFIRTSDRPLSKFLNPPPPPKKIIPTNLIFNWIHFLSVTVYYNLLDYYKKVTKILNYIKKNRSCVHYNTGIKQNQSQTSIDAFDFKTPNTVEQHTYF